MTRINARVAIVGVCALLGLGAGLEADDWPQWRGVDRHGIWTEDGIVDQLPDQLQVTWRVPIQSGYAGPAVAAGRVFVTDWAEDPQSRTMDGRERALALDERTGEVLWTREWPTSYRMLQSSYATGPRATPTVDGDRVYVVGATGILSCFDVASGELIWRTNYVEDYGTFVPTWGIAGAPLVDGDRLIALVGGEPDALVVAFDKHTGDELWRALNVTGELGYGQPVIYEAGGVRQLIVWHPTALVALDPTTGATYWEQPFDAGLGLSIATPVKGGSYLLVSHYLNGSMMMRLNADRPAATMLWKGQSRSELPDETDGLHSLITTPLIIGDYAYGVGSYGELRGLDARTGERLWMSREMTVQARWSTAFMVRHGDRYFVNNDDGDLLIAQFTPTGYVELGRTTLIEADGRSDRGLYYSRQFRGTPRAAREGQSHDRPINWTHPAYANRHIVQRNNSEIIRASLAAADYD